MAAVEGSMGVAVTLPGAILAAVAMDGVAAVTGGVEVTAAVGTVVVVGMGAAGTADAAGTGAVGMVVVPIGGVTHTRMDTDLMVGNSIRKR